jgi:hypothetical protein
MPSQAGPLHESALPVTEEVEMTGLCLRILQAALVYVNTSCSKTSSPRNSGPACSARPTGAA